MAKKLYAHRDAEELDKAGGFYCAHVQAMTEESLHSKSEIAAELAYRDALIARLKEAVGLASNVMWRCTVTFRNEEMQDAARALDVALVDTTRFNLTPKDVL